LRAHSARLRYHAAGEAEKLSPPHAASKIERMLAMGLHSNFNPIRVRSFILSGAPCGRFCDLLRHHTMTVQSSRRLCKHPLDPQKGRRRDAITN
jgi:hypothetical protein